MAGFVTSSCEADVGGAWRERADCVANIGMGGQGRAHLQNLAKMNDVSIAAVCDVDQSRCDAAADAAGSSPRKCKDFREILDMKEVDAVFIATPGALACDTGAHGLSGGQGCVRRETARPQHSRGASVYRCREEVQSRDAGRHAAAEHAALDQCGQADSGGEIGKVAMVHVWNTWNSKEMFGDIGRAEDSDPPAGVDYDMWLGPAPKRKFNRLRFPRHALFFWAYGGGMMIEWAVHLFGRSGWAMGHEVKSVATVGGKFAHDDARETPDTSSAVFDCPGTQ